MGPGSRQRHRSRSGRGAAAVLGVVLALGLTACGDDDGEPSADPSETVSASTTPSPTPTKKTAPPLSEFEDQKPVKVMRRWLRLAAKAVNRGDRKVVRARRILTAEGVREMPNTIAEDLGLYYPGPIPFTPTRVDINGKRAEIHGCLWGEGFAHDRKTKKPARKREILPAQFWLVREATRWKVDNLYDATVSCDGVQMRGVEW